jgi:hypothetical protein
VNRKLPLAALLLFVFVLLLPGAVRGNETNPSMTTLFPGVAPGWPATVPVLNLYWDTTWDGDQPNLTTASVDGATRDVLDSPYEAKLGQYESGDLVFERSATALDKCGARPPNSVDQNQVIGFLSCEARNGGIPSPGISRNGDRIVNVILPLGVTARIDVDFGTTHIHLASCNDFGGYHYISRTEGLLRPIVFTVLPAQCAQTRDAMLAVMTHELTEAVTDPDDAPVPIYWTDRTMANPFAEGETADICSAIYNSSPTDSDASLSMKQRAQRYFRTVAYANTSVAAYWSNADNACVVATKRVVYSEFRSLGPQGPTGVMIYGVTHPLVPGAVYRTALLEGTLYAFTDPTPGSGQRYVQFGDCSGAAKFPLNDTLAAAHEEHWCGSRLEDQVSFTASGLSGQPWRVWFNGIPHDGPTSTWVADGTSFPFTYEDVAGCTFTGATPSSPVFVSGGPVTVTGNYNCPPPPPPPPVTYPDVIRGDGPVAYWRLGDSGPTAHDSGPFGLDGSYEPGVTEGVPGAVVNDPDTAAEFAGGGVAMPNYFGLDILGPLSVEVWARGGAQQPYAYLVSKSDWSGTIGYSLYAGPNGTLRFFVGTGSAQITDETGFTWDGQWHHIVGVYDGSTVSLYVDKALVASTPASGTIQSSFGTPLTLGRFNGGGFTFAGDLDEVAIYDHALTADQIHHHYNQAIFGSISG